MFWNLVGGITCAASITIIMLSLGSHVTQVFTSPTTGLLSTPQSQYNAELFIECSTITVFATLSISAAVTASNLGYFTEIPVSGGPTGAAAGTFSFMGDGDHVLVERIELMVLTLGQSFFHCGVSTHWPRDKAF